MNINNIESSDSIVKEINNKIDKIEQLENKIQLLEIENDEMHNDLVNFLLELEELRIKLTSEKTLSDQLAIALAAQGSASFDNEINLNMKRLALDAFKKSRKFFNPEN